MPKISSPVTKSDIHSLKSDMRGLKSDMRGLKSGVHGLKKSNQLLNNQFDSLSYDLSYLNKRFDNLEGKLAVWKSEIHNLIDSGFTSKAKLLDEEVGILNGRTSNLRSRTEKLEVAVFGKST